MKNPSLSRRHVLAALGAFGAALALPTLPSLIRTAAADTGKPPKRFIAISHGLGHHVPSFFPTAAADIKVNDHTFYKKLVDIAGPMSTILGPKFDAYRSRMNIYNGLDSVSHCGHQSTIPLCASGPVDTADNGDKRPLVGRSIDVLMANSAKVTDAFARFKAIRIATNGGMGLSFDRDASGAPVALSSLVGDANVFNALFDGAGTGTADQAARQAAAAKHKLLVDRSFERYQALKGNPRMSAADRQRFEAHVANVTDLQKRIGSAASCSKPGYVPYAAGAPRENLWRNNIDALVAAMACDMTRVGTVYIEDFKFGPTQDGNEHHGNSHEREANPLATAQSVQFSAFKADQVLHLLNKLSTTIESDGSSMLDNTVVLWTAEMGNSTHHKAMNLPVVTFGGAQGALKTGYLMDFRLKPFQYEAGRAEFFPIGQSYGRLLVTLMRAMGMQESEYINEGDGGGFGEFRKDLNYIGTSYTQFIAQRNTPLPIVF